jgi:hypothetical protein
MLMLDKETRIAKFHEELKQLNCDKETAHVISDYFLLKMLLLLGHEDVVDAWLEEERTYKWWKRMDNKGITERVKDYLTTNSKE